jgi:hypothetical protein
VTDLDVFEIEDREIVIFKFFGCVKGYDVVQGPNEFANPSDRRSPHTQILPAQRERAGKSDAALESWSGPCGKDITISGWLRVPLLT